MKKVLICLLLLSVLFLTGCEKGEEKKVKKKLFSNVEKLKGYYLEATMEIVNNDDVYEYDVKASYYKGDYYKVELQNKSNNYSQIIIKNKDGVYVITPSLNKSFKFQSEWPYNNSQAYLLHSVVNDMKTAKDLEVRKENDNYIFTTSNINYPNNAKLTHQEFTIDKNGELKRVRVMDVNNVAHITVNFISIDKNAAFDEEYFAIDESTEKFGQEKETINQITEINEAIFPLYLPIGTTLSNQEKINKDKGERIIMTFSGEKSFLLVEETSSKYDDFTIIPTNGEPFLIIDTIGVLTDESISWSSNGLDYYIVSDVMTKLELIEVAKSINAIPVMK